MQQLGQLIVENEDWLVDRVVHYAVAEGFSEFTSTLREAWRASICGLSGPILEAIRAADCGPGSNAGFGHARETIVAFGVEQAMRHRARGVRLADFLGLMNYYCRAYLDLIDESDLAQADRRKVRGYVLDFFDHMEIGLCTEWNASSDADRLRDLQDQNKQLSNEKNKYLTIFESIREPVILLDAGGAPVHLNHAAHRVFYGEVAPGASYYGALRSPLLNSQVAEILENCAENCPDMAIETLSGPREFNINVQRMLDISRKFDGTVIILNDVSEYKRALRQARAADHAKSTFLAAMSHEIRTPIAGALGLARLLRDTPLTDRQSHLVDGIISSAELLSGVVGDILDFSQAEVGGRSPASQDFELAHLVRQVLMVVEPLAQEKGLQLSTEISADVPPRLHGDASMIRQVLLNLTHNAIKFTEGGVVHVEVGRLGPGSTAPGRIHFEVRDTGVGLPEGSTDWLFDPFTKGNRSGDGLTGGLGLGLAICRKIVRQVGGDIGCRGNDGGGSVFFVDLPLAVAQDIETSDETRQTAAPANILVVDDDEVNRLVAEGFLAKLGHRSTMVCSASEALQNLQSGQFDLVLSDNRMPGISGLELVERIRALKDGPNAGIPVVVVTASAGDISSDTAKPMHPDGFLAKPYDAVSLAQAISRHLPERVQGEEPATISLGPDAGDENLSVLEQHIAHLGAERGLRVIRAFLENAPTRIEALRANVMSGDRDGISSVAHTLAGASGLLGISGVEALARDIEARANDSVRAVTQEDVSALEARIAGARRALLEMGAQPQDTLCPFEKAGSTPNFDAN